MYTELCTTYITRIRHVNGYTASVSKQAEPRYTGEQRIVASRAPLARTGTDSQVLCCLFRASAGSPLLCYRSYFPTSCNSLHLSECCTSCPGKGKCKFAHIGFPLGSLSKLQSGRRAKLHMLGLQARVGLTARRGCAPDSNTVVLTS